jgi:predicted nucleic acid-binding protein
MSVLVDTSVWSLALRPQAPPNDAQTSKLRSLLEQGQPIVLPGVALQEILQGIRDVPMFEKVKDYMDSFPLLELHREDFVSAAELMSLCRSKGVQASTIDFQIAAACIQHDLPLLTADKDFTNIARYCPLQLL